MESNYSDPAVLVRQWRREFGDAVKQYAEAANRMAALRKMIEGIEALHPEVQLTPYDPAVVTPDQQEAVDSKVDEQVEGTAAEAVRAILRANPNSWFTSGAMVREFSKMGRSDSSTAIRLALRRTATTGVSEKRGADKHQSFRLLVEGRNDDNPLEVF